MAGESTLKGGWHSGRFTHTLAAIDFGTNNCPLLVAKASVEGFEVIDAYSRPVRLDEGVALSASLVEWAQLARSTGSAAPKPMGGRRGCKLDGERDWRLAEKPDLTLHALLAELRDRGVTAVSGCPPIRTRKARYYEDEDRRLTERLLPPPRPDDPKVH